MRFEYKTVIVKGSVWGGKVEQRADLLDDALNALGAVGWELVSVMPYGHYIQATLKRPK